MGNQQGSTIQHMDLCSVLCGSLDGRGVWRRISPCSHSVISEFLQPHGKQNARPPCLAPTFGACSNSCPSSWWCHPTISSYVCPLLLLSPISSSIRVFSSSPYWLAKVLELQLQHQFFQWIFKTDFLLDWLVWFPCSSRFSRAFSNTTVQNHQFFDAQLSLWPNSHIHTQLLEENGYMYIYGWVPLLFTWNSHILLIGYTQIQNKKDFKK